MSTTLISFLGRTQKGEKGYRLTRYDFGDGSEQGEYAYFGWPLAQRIQPDHFVILGTSGSMWDHLFETDHNFGEQYEEERLQLVEAVGKKCVNAEMLTPLQPLLEEQLGCKVFLELIPHGQQEDEQIQMIEIIARHVAQGERVHMDITHGFRTLPMIGLISALYLQKMRSAEIVGLWYGEYNPDTGQAPVHDLKGLLHIADWLNALTCYDKDGDYGTFAPLLGEHGRLLAQAAFHERTTHSMLAYQQLSSWSKADSFPQNDPAAALFKEKFEERISWHKRGTRAAREQRLAREYLERGDYVRAAIYGMESMISQHTYQQGIADEFNNREESRIALMAESQEFKTLSRLRNALAHGIRSHDKSIERILRDEQQLSSTLKDIFKKLSIK